MEKKQFKPNNHFHHKMYTVAKKYIYVIALKLYSIVVE